MRVCTLCWFSFETAGVHTLQNIIDYMSHGYSFSAAIQHTTANLRTIDMEYVKIRNCPYLAKPLQGYYDLAILQYCLGLLFERH